jgi:hypothetical protein
MRKESGRDEIIVEKTLTEVQPGRGDIIKSDFNDESEISQF